MSQNKWFEVSKIGLSKLLTRQANRAFIIYELVQNAWDEATKNVSVEFHYSLKNKSAILVVIDDNPEGFKDITHSYTLFAESEKKKDVKKRGRFNLGEKLVLACCQNATIVTTKGTVCFASNGNRRTIDDKIEKGSQFTATIPIEEKEYFDICRAVKKLIPPDDICTTFNGERIVARNLISSFEAVLPTEISDEEGNIRPTERKCLVKLYQPSTEVQPLIYEMGIPVASLKDDKFHIDIQQKVPLSFDRTCVPTYYLKKLRALVLNETYDLLTKEEAAETWVQDASSNKLCTSKAITKVVDLRFGTKRVSFDLSDPEANKLAVSQGYTVITGGTFSKQQWDNIRKSTAILPAGQVTPSDKILSSSNGVPPIEESKLTDGQKRVISFTKAYASKLLGININVEIFNIPTIRNPAWYGGRTLSYNIAILGKKFFENFPQNIKEVIEVCLHEFTHEKEPDHLSSRFNNILGELGAESTIIGWKEPSFFSQFIK